MMSNYPAGVTGNEWQISGPSWEGTVSAQCPMCDHEDEFDGADLNGTLVIECHECGFEWQEDSEGFFGNDPDYWHDSRCDREDW